MNLAWILSFACLAAVAALLACEARQSRWRAGAKLAASACFVAVPLAGGANFDSSYPALIISGLVLGAFGDAALLGDSKRALLVGLVFFLFGHLAYVVAFSLEARLAAPGLAVAALFALLGAAGIAPRAGGLMVPVAVYSLVIAAMVATALGQPSGWMVPTGAILFAVSDLFVARQRFLTRALINKLLGLPTYYAGQLLIAWSAISR